MLENTSFPHSFISIKWYQGHQNVLDFVIVMLCTANRKTFSLSSVWIRGCQNMTWVFRA